MFILLIGIISLHGYRAKAFFSTTYYFALVILFNAFNAENLFK